MTTADPDANQKPLRTRDRDSVEAAGYFLDNAIRSGNELLELKTRGANLSVAERWKDNFEIWRSRTADGLRVYFYDEWPSRTFLDSTAFGESYAVVPYELLQHIDKRGEEVVNAGVKRLRSLAGRLEFALVADVADADLAVHGREGGAGDDPALWVSLGTGLLAIGVGAAIGLPAADARAFFGGPMFDVAFGVALFVAAAGLYFLASPFVRLPVPPVHRRRPPTPS